MVAVSYACVRVERSKLHACQVVERAYELASFFEFVYACVGTVVMCGNLEDCSIDCVPWIMSVGETT